MKRIAISAISALALLTPMIATPSYAGLGGQGVEQRNQAAQQDRGDRNGGDRTWNRDGDNRGQANNNDRQYNGDRGDRGDNRNFDRNDRRDNNWRGDDRRDNNWKRSDYRRYDGRGRDVGYRDWRRGDRLPRDYRSHYREIDYRDHGWRSPPRGYHYVRDDRGDALLVGIATGAILSVILSGN